MINFSEVSPRQIHDLGKLFNLMTRLENVLKTSLQGVLKCLEEVFKTCWRRLLKMSWRHFCKTFWRCLEDVLARSREDVLKTVLQDALKTSWKRLENVWPRQIYWYWSRRLQNVLKTSSGDVWVKRIYLSWKTSSKDKDERRLQDVFIKTDVCWGICQTCNGIWIYFTESLWVRYIHDNSMCYLIKYPCFHLFYWFLRLSSTYKQI